MVRLVTLMVKGLGSATLHADVSMPSLPRIVSRTMAASSADLARGPTLSCRKRTGHR